MGVGRMRPVPPGPSVERPAGPRNNTKSGHYHVREPGPGQAGRCLRGHHIGTELRHGNRRQAGRRAFVV
eukprot:5273777-Pyramimonas_sp.AAC.1